MKKLMKEIIEISQLREDKSNELARVVYVKRSAIAELIKCDMRHIDVKTYTEARLINVTQYIDTQRRFASFKYDLDKDAWILEKDHFPIVSKAFYKFMLDFLNGDGE